VIVLDSSFLVGFYNERDAHHPVARTLMGRFLAGTWGAGLLLEYVFLEIMTVLLLRRDLPVAGVDPTVVSPGAIWDHSSGPTSMTAQAMHRRNSYCPALFL